MDSFVYVTTVIYTYYWVICASLNHRKRMKAEPSRQIPQKLAARLEFVLL